MNIIEKEGELKLTAKEYLPTKIVCDIYNKGFIKDEAIERGITKLRKEMDVMPINLTRILAELSKVVKKRNKKSSLTKKGKMQLNDDYELLKNIFQTFGLNFNWAYYDGYGDNEIGQLGFGFSLIMLSKHGSEKHTTNFYAEKYIKAFPDLIEQFEPAMHFRTIEEQVFRCYSVRTFERFLNYFGLINLESKNKKWGADTYITKTELFDKLIKILPHNDIHKIPND